MLSYEIEKRLEELKDCELALFTMQGNIQKTVHLNELNVYYESEFLESTHPADNFASPFLDILSISPLE